MADVKEKISAATSFTLTSANLATSTTAGWMSDVVDNTATLYLDALVHVELAAVNTAPSGSKTIYIFAYGLADPAGTVYTSTGDGVPSGTVGTITFPAVTTNALPIPLIGTIPYPTQNKALNGGPFSVASAFSGILPAKWGLCIINDANMTLNVTAIKWVGVYATVV